MSEIRFSTYSNPSSIREQRENLATKPMVEKAPTEKESFSKALGNILDDVNEAQVKADKDIKSLVSGENKNIHEVMLSMEKADLAMKLGMQIRNKVIEAYKEVMRMQV